MNGRDIAAGQTTATVVVHPFPQPLAQITVLVFEDNDSINGAYDQPAEHGLSNFQLLVSDVAGALQQDQFTYPLGTTYKYAYECTQPACIALNVPADASGNPLPPEQQPIFQYDADGLPVVDYLGDGIIRTCGGAPSDYPTGYYDANCKDPYTLTDLAAGEAVIRYMSENKYAIEPVVPGSGTPCNSDSDCHDMLLTATLEGTRQNDAWVRATEPRYNIALGQLNWLVFYGFVHNNVNTLSTLGASVCNITGQVVYAHDAHPPLSPGLSPGLPVANAYVGLNNLSGNDEQVYTAAADPNTGQFSIAGVPAGTYQLVMWDKPINAIIDFRTITCDASTPTIAMGPVSVYGWFATVTGTVFQDNNQDGYRQSTEGIGIPNVPVNLRFSDGSMYANATTGPDGGYTVDQYFTWWRYLVAEVGLPRFKPTGITAVVDDGGNLPTSGAFAGTGINPQLQPAGSSPGGRQYRTERSTAVTEAFQLFQDMTARIDFGQHDYDVSGCATGDATDCQNGGIRGQVNYATTRTEEDPHVSAIDGWEPGIPRVTVHLHRGQQYCDDVNCSACTQDGIDAGATPQGKCWAIDPDEGAAGFPLTTTSDSWDDHQPTDCVGKWNNAAWGETGPGNEIVNGYAIPSCAETFHKWDQTRPGRFDGAYTFEDMGDDAHTPIAPGPYIVEVVPPAGYKVVSWGDRNIEFGDPKIPFLKELPDCVGPLYDVPQYHTLFPDQMVETDTSVSDLGPWVPGLQAAGCNMKEVSLNPGDDGTTDFNLFTFVPKAARIWGTVWNDLALEFRPDSPNASGNLAVPYLPVAIKDWKGTEVARFYTDQWGHFDGLVPANYDIAPPIPVGLVLQMYTIAPNDPGPIHELPLSDPGQWITDPFFNPAYSQEVIRENWEFYPGRTTFIDTIVLPVSAFVTNPVPVNCSYVAGTPEIQQVSDVIIPATGMGITITAVPGHGFGAAQGSGTVTVGGTPIAVTGWADGAITATVPGGLSGELVVTADNGLSSTVGVTLHAVSAGAVSCLPGGYSSACDVLVVDPPAANCVGIACGVVQPAIDAAKNGAIVVLTPDNMVGVGRYQENVNLWKPITLQGLGAAVTILDGTAALGNFALKDWQFATSLIRAPSRA